METIVSIDQRIIEHDETINQHRQRLHQHKEWLRKQRENISRALCEEDPVKTEEHQNHQQLQETAQPVELDSTTHDLSQPVELMPALSPVREPNNDSQQLQNTKVEDNAHKSEDVESNQQLQNEQSDMLAHPISLNEEALSSNTHVEELSIVECEEIENIQSNSPKITAKTREILNSMRTNSQNDTCKGSSFLEKASPRRMYNYAGEDDNLDDLLKRNEFLAIKRSFMIHEAWEKEREMHHPKINPVSLAIAAKLSSTARERLYSNAKTLSPKNKHNQQDTPEVFSFSPNINQKSRDLEELRRSNKGVMARIDSLYNREKKKVEYLKQLKTQQLETELEQCTFSPLTRGGYVETVPPKPFNERALKWEAKRKNRIDREKTEVEKKIMEECTFQPNIDRKTPDKHVIKSVVEEPIGFEQFIQRQKQARMQKGSTQQIFKTGDKWKNEITTPLEFNIGKHKKHSIKSLNKPVTPNTQSPSTLSSPRSIHPIEDFNLLQQTHYCYDNEVLMDMEKMEELAQSHNIPLIDTETIPPQGLFSIPLSQNILHMMGETSPELKGRPRTPRQDLWLSPPSSPMGSDKLIDSQILTPSPEWLKRRKEKEEDAAKLQQVCVTSRCSVNLFNTFPAGTSTVEVGRNTVSGDKSSQQTTVVRYF